jgi:methionine synthase I (cobalamin-dependent)
MIWLDGGLGTTLMEAGLPPGAPAHEWLNDHLSDVAAVHQRFVDAGAQAVLTATLTVTANDAKTLVPLALHAASAAGVPIWGSVGPVGDPSAVIDALAPYVDGLVLETFLELDQALDYLRIARTRTDLPVAVTLVPNEQPSDALRKLQEAGAHAVGFNCGTSPTHALHALNASEPTTAPLWMKPSGGPDWPNVIADLRRRCAFLGGCCGVGPSQLGKVTAR